ncbi:hypothetical protein CQZ99_10070 [Pseudomonas poae]|uniref:Uncharacterized protein n=1 Tax=Pseudomonas poae TaxID=200451 RepID=A0A2S9EUS7_9PSED|nr:hypothetical protein CQZ97_00535 [Pseudomonas poae]PRC19683.1 hypothetical protein CQZ99_10070 [Pseudomonas poae]
MKFRTGFLGGKECVNELCVRCLTNNAVIRMTVALSVDAQLQIWPINNLHVQLAKIEKECTAITDQF